MSQDYSININTNEYNVDIGQDQDFTIEINEVPDIVINLNKQGPPGPQGKPGDSYNIIGSELIDISKSNLDVIIKSKTFVYEQATASDTWEINHNLNKHPSVVIVDSSGASFEGQVNYIDENNCIVYMNGATTGTAYLN